MKYIAYKDSKAFMKDLKRVYWGPRSEEIAFRNLEAMKDSWKKYRAVVENWQMKWEKPLHLFQLWGTDPPPHLYNEYPGGI